MKKTDFLPSRSVSLTTGLTRAELLGEYDIDLWFSCHPNSSDIHFHKCTDDVREFYQHSSASAIVPPVQQLANGCSARVLPQDLIFLKSDLQRVMPDIYPPPRRKQNIPSVTGKTRSHLTTTLVSMIDKSPDEIAQGLGGSGKMIDNNALNGALIELYLAKVDELSPGRNPYRKKNGTLHTGNLSGAIHSHMPEGNRPALKTIIDHVREALKSYNDYPDLPPSEELTAILKPL